MMIPRIGQEVVVDFLEGDPDRLLITGRVYNGEQPAVRAAGLQRRAWAGAAAPARRLDGELQRIRMEDLGAPSSCSSTPRRTRANEVENDQTLVGRPRPLLRPPGATARWWSAR